MTTPDYVEASLTLAPDGAAPVFHMVRLPDSVVFVQVKRRAPTLISDRYAQWATTGNSVLIAWPNNDTGHENVFVAKSSDDGCAVKQSC
jgi:hypothetical protein